ncbi:MAG: class I SAM-dependent methyltransferase [Bryobacteraceae bacterium]
MTIVRSVTRRRSVDWAEFWQNQTSALHQATSEQLVRYSRELALLFAELSPRSVLDLGCGDGELYDSLGFDRVSYRGVDMSQSMLDVFQREHPGTELICRNALDYLDDSTYDLVFSNAMVQFLNREQMRHFFENVKRMMHADSVFVCASIPCSLNRYAYISRQLVQPYRKNRKMVLATAARRALGLGDTMGCWYSPAEIKEMAVETGFVCNLYGSMHNMFRFHAVLELPRERR